MEPWRNIFKKGFSTDHVLRLLPGMVEETLLYQISLRELVS